MQKTPAWDTMSAVRSISLSVVNFPTPIRKAPAIAAASSLRD
jgi:hypothetical protein